LSLYDAEKYPYYNSFNLKAGEHTVRAYVQEGFGKTASIVHQFKVE
jgi:hypothetical protein